MQSFLSTFSIGRLKSRSDRAEAGYTPLQVSASLIVMAIMAGVLGNEVNIQIKKSKDSAAADQLNEVYVAAQNWVKGNTQNLANLVQDAGGVYQIPAGRAYSDAQIPEVSLQGQGFMPSGFVDTNAYGQHSVMTVWADENNPSGYNMMVYTTGGATIKDVDIGRIGQKLNAAGGGYYSGASPGRPSGTISGVGGGWSYPANELAGDYATPTPGHVAASGQFTISGGLADFLYRNDIGIHEANTMHADIDMTQKNLNAVGRIDNVNPTTGVSNGSLGIGSSIVGSYVSDPSNHTIFVDSDMNICHNDAISSPECGISIASTGGFYHNGSWISYWGGVSGGGLHIEGPGNNFQVDGGANLVGQITAETGLDLISGGPITWSQAAPGLSVAGDLSPYSRGYQLHIMGKPLAVDAMAYFDGNVTTRYVYDTDDNSYFLHPSGVSRLNVGKFSGNVATNGADPDKSWPAGFVGAGLTTGDIYSDGSVGIGTGKTINAYMTHQGVVAAAQYVQSQVFRPAYEATEGKPCSSISALDTGSNWSDGQTDAASFEVKNGDIAKDTQGRMLNCVNGQWRYPGGMQFSRQIASGCINSEGGLPSGYSVAHQDGKDSPEAIHGENKDSSVHLLNVYFSAGKHGVTSAYATVNGQKVAWVDSTINEGRVSQSITFVAPPDGVWEAGYGWNQDDVCFVEYQ
ncbi:shufflon system plasmid conjugative transfer pilus tip adhesin PilV [Acetobacter persici]|nr:shufflon system plasmid conjugative transfer pilus tip adhesin PilV [Acetobacter persici]